MSPISQVWGERCHLSVDNASSEASQEEEGL